MSHGLLVEEIGTTNLDLPNKATHLYWEKKLIAVETLKATSSIEELNIDEEWRILNLNNVRVFADKLKNNAGYVMDITRQLENKIVGNINGELVDTQERLLQSKKMDLIHFRKNIEVNQPMLSLHLLWPLEIY